jgi:hypothetical protein
MAGLGNNFQGHRWLLEQLLESLAAIEKPEKGSWRGLHEGFSQLVCDFMEATGSLFNLLKKYAACYIISLSLKYYEILIFLWEGAEKRGMLWFHLSCSKSSMHKSWKLHTLVLLS